MILWLYTVLLSLFMIPVDKWLLGC